MKTNKSGFTLTELLAVVLIIGILTSIALPQYNRSIARADATTALVTLRSIFDSAKRYKAANSVPPMKLQGLDISIFDASSDTTQSFTLDKFVYIFSNSRVSACRLPNKDYCFNFYYNHDTYGKDTLTCEVVNRAKYSWLCENMGDTAISDAEFLMKG